MSMRKKHKVRRMRRIRGDFTRTRRAKEVTLTIKYARRLRGK